MHNQADQLSKSILRDALSLASAAETEVEVLAATQKIDVYAVPDPARAQEREKMGLIGVLSAEPSLFEPFRNTPSLGRVRRCLSKQLAWHHELERRARASGTVEVEVTFPWLVVISPGRPETVLEGYRMRHVLPGVHEAVPCLQMRVVVLAELPRTRETLLLRLLGAGRLLKEALADLSALPADAWEASVARPILIHFGIEIRREPGTDEEDDVTSAEIRAWYEDYQQKQEKLRDDAVAAGRARDVLTVLRARDLAVPDAVRERILAEKDLERLERWLERAVVATSVAEAIDDPS